MEERQFWEEIINRALVMADEVKTTVIRLEGRVDNLSERVTRVETDVKAGFDDLKASMKELDQRRFKLIMWVLGIAGTLITAGIIATIARVFG